MGSPTILDLIGNATPNRRVKVLGIDLGTTNSTVSQIVAMPDDTPLAKTLEVDQPTLQGLYTHTLVPSFVAIQSGQTFVGEGAKRLRGDGTIKDATVFYDCKNDIGLKKTYHKAPKGYRSAAEIGGHVLKFLREAAAGDDAAPLDGVVVTVPASFQANQRQDTIQAASAAAIDLTPGQLLDEPMAAFIDYLVSKGAALVESLAKPKTLLVFDFGGGTCDVAIFRLQFSGKKPTLKAATLAVSRYHRLGGGDIDAAILHEVLLPQLLEQNGLSGFDLGFIEKKKQIEPALIGVAEQLKIKLCNEVRKLQSFGKYDDADKSTIIVIQPGVYECKLGDKSLKLASPALSAAAFEQLLSPFLDHDLLYARETEYRLTCSVFAPLQDSLDRAGLDKGQIDYCLMVGGSSLIPNMIAELDAFLSNAQVLTYPDKDSVKTCVSRGAAYHALALALTGKGIIQPVCHDDISICTASGTVKLVPKGAALPYPGDGGFAGYDKLAVPTSKQNGTCPIRVELVAGDEGRNLFAETWEVPGPVKKKDGLLLQYRFDENQVLELRLSLAKAPDNVFEPKIEKPLTSVVNPHRKQERALEIEEELKTGGLGLEPMVARMSELASLYGVLDQRERAIDILKAVLQKKQPPDPGVLNRIAILYGEIGDFAKQEKFYKEAGKAAMWTAPWFNLALSQKKQGKWKEAVENVEKGLAIEHEAPLLVLRAMLAEHDTDMNLKQSLLKEAKEAFNPIAQQSDWELGWCSTAADMLADEKLKVATEEEREKRAQGGSETVSRGQLPLESDGSSEVRR